MALFGEMGTGKTSLVRGIADGLGAEPMAVSSPTFTLIHEYRGRLPLIHTDLYRLTAAQLDNTGLGDYVDGYAVLAIEWAERWGAGLPNDRLEIHLTHRPHLRDRRCSQPQGRLRPASFSPFAPAGRRVVPLEWFHKPVYNDPRPRRASH